MLAAALRRNRGNRALHHLEQRLLDALARYIARDRGIFGLAADLVDLVDIDDPALCPLDVVIRRLEQLEDDILDILADIARSEEHTSELQSLMRISYAVFCLKKKKISS